MGRHASHVAVVTADIIESSRYSQQDRRRLDGILRKAFEDVQQQFRDSIHTRMAFRITAGDEFQFVVSAIPQAFTVLMYLRALVAAGGLLPPIRFRASLGVGEISVPKRASPYEEDGAAFVRSRRGLEGIAKGGSRVRWTSLITGAPEVDSTADVVLCLATTMPARASSPAWPPTTSSGTSSSPSGWASDRLTRGSARGRRGGPSSLASGLLRSC